MFSPIGHTAISELVPEDWTKQNEVFDLLASSLAALTCIYATNENGNVMKMPAKILASFNGEFLLIDHFSWTITLDKIRAGAQGIDKGNLTVGMMIASGMRADDGDLRVPEMLIAYEGWSLTILDIEVEAFQTSILLGLEEKPKSATNILSKKELEEMYKEFLAPFEAKDKWPTEKQREEWRHKFGVKRPRERELWEDYKPDNVAPGRPRKS